MASEGFIDLTLMIPWITLPKNRLEQPLIALAKVAQWKMPGSFWSGTGYNSHLTDVKILAQQLGDIRSKYGLRSAKRLVGRPVFLLT
jgi:hypothetical protein